ncbi:MAG: hypothetical protein WAL64_07715 [Candidatus Dormiibacterota bacterium]
MIQLESQIAQVFNLLAVLLVFVLAYFSAVLPQALSALSETDPASLSGLDDSSCTALVGRMSTYRWLMLGSAVLVVLVGVVVSPLTHDVLQQPDVIRWSTPPTFSGLLLVDVCLFGMLVTALVFIARLTVGIAHARAQPQDPAPTGLGA